ncbi:MAG: YgiQ family radical SAM protein [Desulfobulbus sp.]|nr:YgiQ family radical SAM protein [Desulfobulbus sp.]
MFLPCTLEEMAQLGWEQLDVILVSGDAYIDSPFIGVAVIGKLLAREGFRVGIIAQPDPGGQDITRLGEPRLFWGISGGSVDSMVANRTASGKRRKSDDYTPGGQNTRRPDRAVLAYANLIRRHFKNTVPLVIGGIEASLRRLAHYDYWDNRIRRSILFDAKADFLLYGMAEKAVVELAHALNQGREPTTIRGLCYAAAEPPTNALILPNYATVAKDKQAFSEMFAAFYGNNDPLTAQILAQHQDSRFLIHNPPQLPLTTAELDAVHALSFERAVHPFDAQGGPVPALTTIRFALTTHRGCYGECNFCAIAVHQGRTIQERSVTSIVKEARELAAHPDFKGMLADVGGPTANMFGFECGKKKSKGACRDKRCLFPSICPSLKIDHGPLINLLQQLRKIQNIKKIAVASGIRYDLILADKKNGLAYLRELVRHHVSGQLKIAPEHSENEVLAAMGKPGTEDLLRFRDLFMRLTREEGLDQFLTYYIIAAHPGCTQASMERLRDFCRQKLHVLPRQVQLFTPTPCTWSTLMYWTENNPWHRGKCFVEKNAASRERQKSVLTAPTSRGAQPKKQPPTTPKRKGYR